MQVSDEHLRGRTVIAADGQAIGEVAALFIDTSTWIIVALQIKLSKSVAEQIGAARGLLRAATLELPVRMVQIADYCELRHLGVSCPDGTPKRS
jgi:sporulation protein YlmC with PRC-barrel domain